jgi:hypothetical protein
MKQSELQSLLFYDNGVFYWKYTKCNRVRVGQRAGGKSKSGYRRIHVLGKRYYEHHLVWIYHYGELPNCQIDHINRIKDDNRIENLRLCPNNHSDNHQNMPKQNNNTSGYTGVTYDKNRKKWQAQIKINGKYKFLGRFNNIEDAVKSRDEGKLKYHRFVS